MKKQLLILLALTLLPVAAVADDSGTSMSEHMHNNSNAYQGPKYFSYQGEMLQEIRLGCTGGLTPCALK